MEVKRNWAGEIVREWRLPRGEFFSVHAISRNMMERQEGGLHLAVLKEPYLEFILKGEKTVESRFSIRRRAPYKRVEKGDVVILKQQSGNVLRAL